MTGEEELAAAAAAREAAIAAGLLDPNQIGKPFFAFLLHLEPNSQG